VAEQVATYRQEPKVSGGGTTSKSESSTSGYATVAASGGALLTTYLAFIFACSYVYTEATKQMPVEADASVILTPFRSV
jgi:hypothetical protein